MPAQTIILPQGFQYVIASLLASSIVTLGQARVVSVFRAKAGIPYPQVYAEVSQVEGSSTALRYNCAQRAHANNLENLPSLWLATLITSLKYPLFAASALGIWSFARIIYTHGYVTGIPEKRRRALFGSVAGLVLQFTAIYTTYSLF